MSKVIYRLTESDLHKLIGESVAKIMNEISRDTIASADDKSEKKWIDLDTKYGHGDPRTIKARNQHNTFHGEYIDRWDKANMNGKATMLKNKDDIKNGKRKYISGKGWRTTDGV